MAYNIIENVKEFLKRYNIICDNSIHDTILAVTEFYGGGRYIQVYIRLDNPEISNDYIILNSIGIDHSSEFNDLYIKFYINISSKIPELISIMYNGDEGLDFNLTDIHVPLHLSIIDKNLNITTDEYLKLKSNNE